MLQVSALATHQGGVGPVQVVLHLPSYLAVNGGVPGGYSVVATVPPSSRWVDVIWPANLTLGVTQTLTLSVTPTAPAATPYHDEYFAFLHRPGVEPSRYAGASDPLYVRVGSAQSPGQIAEEYPDELAHLSAGYELLPGDPGTVSLTDGQGNATPLLPTAHEELAEHEPLSVDLRFGSFTDADTPVTAELEIHNTIDIPVSYTATLALPAGWTLLSGSSTLAETLSPGDTVTHPLLILPAAIPCHWAARVTVRLACPVRAQGYRGFVLEREGGIYPCLGEQDGWEPGEPADGRQVYTGGTTIIPGDDDDAVCGSGSGGPGIPCAACQPACGNQVAPVLPQERTIKVKGYIFAVHDPGDSYLANLRLRVLAGQRPRNQPGGPGMSAVQLAETRLDSLGGFELCIVWRPSIFLEVTATDETKCTTDWTAKTFHPNNLEVPYVAYSMPLNVPQPACGILKTVDYDTEFVEDWPGVSRRHAEAFFPASIVAFDMREFFGQHGPEDISQAPFQARFVYPVSNAELVRRLCGETWGTATSCYREPHILLRAADASYGKVVEHEYGHRAHHGQGGYLQGICRFCENVAETIRLAKEELDDPPRGWDYPVLPWADQVESWLNNYDSGDYRSDYWSLSPLFYDLVDDQQEAISASLECPGWLDTPCADLTERARFAFSTLWNTYLTPYCECLFPPEDGLATQQIQAGQQWVDDFVHANQLSHTRTPPDPCDHPWFNLMRATIFHALYSCGNPLPGGP
jgi:hypothetical protein